MRNFLLRVIINAIGIAITAQLLPGINVTNDDIGTLLIIGLVFGIVNALVKPVLILLTCPAVIISLGLFILVINGLMLLLTASLIPARLTVDGLGAAIIGGIIMGLISMVLEGVLGVKDDDKKKRRDGNVVIIDRR
ncbi:MAG TPA: phage holin family protein [Phototrophicaceae bacterium]|nr:phage holin family protein [Phototrophicaceae bacterium]